MDSLDQSDDFSGGSTPYMRAARRAIAIEKPVKTRRRINADKTQAVRSVKVRQKEISCSEDGKKDQPRLSERSSRRVLRETKGENSTSESESNIRSRKTRKLGSKSKGDIEDENSDGSNSCRDKRRDGSDRQEKYGNVQESVQKTVDLTHDSQEELSEGKSSATAEEAKLKLCSFCGEEFSLAAHQSHIAACMRTKFGRDGQKSSSHNEHGSYNLFLSDLRQTHSGPS